MTVRARLFDDCGGEWRADHPPHPYGPQSTSQKQVSGCQILFGPTQVSGGVGEQPHWQVVGSGSPPPGHDVCGHSHWQVATLNV